MSRSEPTDEELLARYQQADPRAFELFFDRHQKLIFNFLLARLGRAEEADDAVQDVFLRVHRFVAGYDPSRPALPWLFQIARHVLYDRARKIKSFDSIDDHPIEDTRGTPAAQLEAIAELERLLAALSPQDQALIRERLVEERSFDDIAASEGTQAATLRQRLSRLLRRLQSQEP